MRITRLRVGRTGDWEGLGAAAGLPRFAAADARGGRRGSDVCRKRKVCAAQYNHRWIDAHPRHQRSRGQRLLLAPPNLRYERASEGSVSCRLNLANKQTPGGWGWRSAAGENPAQRTWDGPRLPPCGCRSRGRWRPDLRARMGGRSGRRSRSGRRRRRRPAPSADAGAAGSAAAAAAKAGGALARRERRATPTPGPAPVSAAAPAGRGVDGFPATWCGGSRAGTPLSVVHARGRHKISNNHQ